MNIAQVVPVSLCDWPGRVASVLFTRGCNLCCGYCHNKHLIPSQGLGLDPVQVLESLEHRFPKITGVVITGGEPTVQPDLKRFIQSIPQQLKVKLDTNGTDPEALRELIELKLVDYIAMDVKAPWRLYPQVTGCTAPQLEAIQASVALLTQSEIPCMFRTTRIPGLCTDSEWQEVLMQLPVGVTHRWQGYRDSNHLR